MQPQQTKKSCSNKLLLLPSWLHFLCSEAENVPRIEEKKLHIQFVAVQEYLKNVLQSIDRQTLSRLQSSRTPITRDNQLIHRCTNNHAEFLCRQLTVKARQR